MITSFINRALEDDYGERPRTMLDALVFPVPLSSIDDDHELRVELLWGKNDPMLWLNVWIADVIQGE